MSNSFGSNNFLNRRGPEMTIPQSEQMTGAPKLETVPTDRLAKARSQIKGKFEAGRRMPQEPVRGRMEYLYEVLTKSVDKNGEFKNFYNDFKDRFNFTPEEFFSKKKRMNILNKLGYSTKRKSFEYWGGQRQCKIAFDTSDTGDKKDGICWLCGCKLYEDGSPVGGKTPECEHVFPAFHAILFLGMITVYSKGSQIYEKRYFSPMINPRCENLAFFNYYWSHKSCNVSKSDKSVIKITDNYWFNFDEDKLNSLVADIHYRQPRYYCNSSRENIKKNMIDVYSPLIAYMNKELNIFRNNFSHVPDSGKQAIAAYTSACINIFNTYTENIKSEYSTRKQFVSQQNRLSLKSVEENLLTVLRSINIEEKENLYYNPITHNNEISNILLYRMLTYSTDLNIDDILVKGKSDIIIKDTKGNIVTREKHEHQTCECEHCKHD